MQQQNLSIIAQKAKDFMLQTVHDRAPSNGYYGRLAVVTYSFTNTVHVIEMVGDCESICDLNYPLVWGDEPEIMKLQFAMMDVFGIEKKRPDISYFGSIEYNNKIFYYHCSCLNSGIEFGFADHPW